MKRDPYSEIAHVSDAAPIFPATPIDPLDRARLAERALRGWKSLFGTDLRDPTLLAFDHEPARRPQKPVKDRLCRAGCGRRFKLAYPLSPDAVSQQTCDDCLPVFIAAMNASQPSPNERQQREKLPAQQLSRLTDIEFLHLLMRLRNHRAEFEAAWRLGAGKDALREILTSTQS